MIDTNVFVSSVFGGLPREVVEPWFDGRTTLCLSEAIVTEYQRVLREVGAVSEAEERALIEAFASGEGVLYTADPPAIEGASPDPDDDNAERVRRLECALELEADRVVSGDSDLLELESYMGIPILTPRELLEELGQAPGRAPKE
ncbi:MAG: PIN domain-containing protein [Salinivenus sp.]